MLLDIYNFGGLNNCWMLVAMANLIFHKKLFSKVVPSDQIDNFNNLTYAGIFHFRFWQFEEWVEVVVDDYLPIKNGRPLFGKSSDPNEFWSALMEKAYAKLFGNYQAINFGNSIDSLEDFTGGLAQRFYLSALGDNSFEVLMKAYNQNSLITCSTDGKSGEVLII